MGTNDIYIYFTELPKGIDECVISCCGGYTIWIDRRLSDKRKRDALDHAMHHIKNGDLDYNCERSVQQIEFEAHYGS